MGLTAPSLLLNMVGGKHIMNFTRMKKGQPFFRYSLRFGLLSHYNNAIVNMS